MERTDSAPATRARRAILADHAATLDATWACADAVAADLDDPIDDGRALATAFRDALTDAGVLARYPTLLADAVAAADLSLAADPVAAPPYVAVTSRGPVLRGPTADGRLVIELRAFAVERSPRRYVRAPGEPETALVVSVEP